METHIPTTTIDCCTLSRGDCRELLSVLQQATVLITDPPYGVRYRQKRSRDKWVHPDTEHPMIMGDDGPFDPTHLLQLRIPRMILWGGNHYSHRLPPGGKWLVWDKRRDTTPDDNADAELAWTNLPGPTRIFRHVSRGAIREGEENIRHGEKKLHPNQKPAALMAWCLQQASVGPEDVVADPYMGSGTLGVVCLRRNIRYIGIEWDPAYYRIAVTRLQQEAQQLQMPFSLQAARPPAAPPLRSWGGDRKSQAFKQNQGSNVTLKRGNGTAYLTERLRRDHPDILAAWQQGHYPSARAAAKAAGLVKSPAVVDKSDFSDL
jgi:site-specific DNA-methyltransferase (adenine-specific)